MQSVRQQSWHNLEHIIIDGASQDDTLELLKRNSSSKLKFISKKDDGIYDAMNKGANLAQGKYLLFLNAGDHLYDKQVFKKVFSNTKQYTSDLLVGNIEVARQGFKNIWEPRQLLEHPHTFQVLPHCGVFIKRDLFEKNGGYNLHFRIAADIEFFNRILKKKASFIYLDRTISVFYRDGISSTIKGRMIAKLEELQIHWLYYGKLATLRKIIPIPYMGIMQYLKSLK